MESIENGVEKPQRPKLNLKPRDPNAAARLEEERLQAAAKVGHFKRKSN
jgi:hypothetical protein